MRMELLMHPDDARHVSRIRRAFKTAETRPRTRRVRLFLHDTPDHALTATGLALIERRGAWRIERLSPGATIWAPATPAPVLEEATTREGLTTPLPEGLAPVAIIEGQETTHTLLVNGQTAVLTIWRGSAHAAPVPQTPDPGFPLCRIMLDGPEAAVRLLAVQVAATARAEAPRASLATEALSLVSDSAYRPRRSGAPSLPREDASDLTSGSAFRHILGHLVDVLLYLAPFVVNATEDTEPVHQMRVAVRRARSAITVFQGVIGGEESRVAADHLKVLGARLGPTRDWDVFVTETLPEVTVAIPGNKRLLRLCDAAEAIRKAHASDLRAYLTGGDFRVLGVELAWLAAAEGWVANHDTHSISLPDFATQVLQRRWRKLTRAGKTIEGLDIPALHDLRLRTKRARYSAEVFVSLYPGHRTTRYLRRLGRLQQHLGVLNDGAVAAQLLDELGGAGGRHAHACGLVLGFAAARAATVRPDILQAWEKFRHTSRFWG